jgi:hypothetical protein
MATTTIGGRSMLDSMARRFIVPVGLFLDVLGMVIRFTSVMMLLTLPTLYAAWQTHSNPIVALMYYIAAFVAIGSIGLGVTGGLYMTMPLLYKVDKQIEAAQRIRRTNIKTARLKELREKKHRYQGYLKLLIWVIGIFGVSYFFGPMLGNNPLVEIATGAAAIAAQVIIAYVLTQTEREQDAVDTQERTHSAATDIAVEQVRRIGEKFDGETLTPRQAQSLQHGLDGDIAGMIDVLVPRDESEKMYTISELCTKYGCGTDRDDPGRKQIYRIVVLAHDAGELDIVKDRKRGWLVPGKLLDKLFRDWTPPPQMLRLAPDRGWTSSAVQPAQEAG